MAADGAKAKGEFAKDYDVIVVGAGFGGVYAIHKLVERSFSVLGLESAPTVGGVWYHNRYPGARVDIDSFEYSYYFSPDLYREWKWSERYAAQPELLRYINHVADRFDIRRRILFNTPMTSAQWRPEDGRYHVAAGGQRFTCQHLVMATGNLSTPRKPNFPGLDDFKGRWVQTAGWPDEEVKVEGLRVGVVGTGSSGVQVIPPLAEQAAHLHVFQRSPNYSAPARNGPPDQAAYQGVAADVEAARTRLLATQGGVSGREPGLVAAAYTPEEQRERLERQWARGGQAMKEVFADQSINEAANEIVSEFVREKIREIVKDSRTAEALCPKDHPIGTRRLCLDTDYYETFNRDNVTLVDVSADPIERITAKGVKTRDHEYELDLIVFALGFHAFTGALDRAGIRNEQGRSPTDHWDRGPKTMLGLMTSGFPNLFILTGPGSPSVLANMVLMNEHHVDWVADALSYMRERGFDTIEPTLEAQDAWTRQVAEAAGSLLRVQVNNYMVHVNDDGSRVFMPYVGGLSAYVNYASRETDNNYPGFTLKEIISKSSDVREHKRMSQIE